MTPLLATVLALSPSLQQPLVQPNAELQAVDPPARLTINGSKLLEPSGEDIRLLGFNWQITHQNLDTDAAGVNMAQELTKVAPGANTVRLVGILWGNTPSYFQSPSQLLGSHISECMTDEPPYYFKEKCFDRLDAWVKQATDAGLWVILALRGEYVAGQDFYDRPGTVVFRNETLREMMYAMWAHVAEHYSTFERIAAYEILSEPRDKAIGSDVVNDFYAGGCAAVQAVDPRTPCIVGTRPYYKLYTVDENYLIKNNSNVIYTFDYFNPENFVFGRGMAYNQKYPCKDLYKGFAFDVCSTWGVSSNEPISFDRVWHEHNIATFLGQYEDRVPIFANQWDVVYGVSVEQGRYAYMSDFMSVMADHGMGWCWWVAFGGNSGNTFSKGSSEVIFRLTNGSYMLDQAALDTMAPFLQPQAPPPPSPPPDACQSWCAGHDKPWDIKCYWQSCNACSECDS